jgi:RNA polymerase sigma factor (sigma-70 family)
LGDPLAELPDNRELESLLAGCGRQEPAALEALYARTAPQLLGILSRVLGNRASAEDALQDVFVSIWQRAGQYDQFKGRAMGWMVAIARHRAIDMQRSTRPTVLLEVAELAGAHSLQVDSAAEQVEFRAAHQALRRCLELLSAAQRQCVLLAFRNGLTQERIAQNLNQPLGSVKSWVRRGLQSLKGCLES